MLTSHEFSLFSGLARSFRKMILQICIYLISGEKTTENFKTGSKYLLKLLFDKQVRKYFT